MSCEILHLRACHVNRKYSVANPQNDSGRIRFQHPGQVSVKGPYSYFTALSLYLLPSFVPDILSSLILVQTHAHQFSSYNTNNPSVDKLIVSGQAQASVQAALQKWTLVGSPLPVEMPFCFPDVHIQVHLVCRSETNWFGGQQYQTDGASVIRMLQPPERHTAPALWVRQHTKHQCLVSPTATPPQL